MTAIHFSGRQCLALLACVSLLAACEPPSGGYYDRNGTWIPTDTPHNMEKRAHAPSPGYDSRYDHGDYYEDYYYDYDRRGYYDRYGYYDRDDLGVPEGMFPPRGMCRVWFKDRPVSEQPPVESCNSIRARVPYGAYVIYGG